MKLKLLISFFWPDSEFRNVFYSQEGEDILLSRILDNQENGFFVDIGAHHPFRFSNTYLFYKKGWRGLNVDALPGTKKLFDRYRPRDINLEIGVSDGAGDLEYIMFDEPALNGFNPEISNSERVGQSFKLLGKKRVPTMALGQILEKYLPPNNKIDFLSIDVEGFEFEVLNSNDWKKFIPRIIVIEMIKCDLKSGFDDKVSEVLKKNGYSPYSKVSNSVIWVQPNVVSWSNAASS